MWPPPDSGDGPQAVGPDLTEETEIVAIGGSVTAASLFRAYASGVFPMDVAAVLDDGTETEILAWFAPDPRAVLRSPGMHVSRSLRRSMRAFAVTFDRAFEDVVAGCADPNRPHGWITADYERAYLELYRQGHAHSVEVWQAGTLVGGVLGVQIGGLICADSMFSHATDASKAALATLSARVFGARDGRRRLIDAQWLTDHLASLGFVEVERSDYEAALPALVTAPPLLGRSTT